MSEETDPKKKLIENKTICITFCPLCLDKNARIMPTQNRHKKIGLHLYCPECYLRAFSEKGVLLYLERREEKGDINWRKGDLPTLKEIGKRGTDLNDWAKEVTKKTT